MTLKLKFGLKIKNSDNFIQILILETKIMINFDLKIQNGDKL